MAFRSSQLPEETAWGSPVPDVSSGPTNLPVPIPSPNISGGMAASVPRLHQMVIRHVVEQEPALVEDPDLLDRALSLSPDARGSIAEVLEQASPRTIASMPSELAENVLPMLQSQAGNGAVDGFMRAAFPDVGVGGRLDVRFPVRRPPGRPGNGGGTR